MSYAFPMPREIKLPSPWRHMRFISDDERTTLENVLGTGLSYSDLNEDDITRDSPDARLPKSRKSYLVMAFNWAEIMNEDTGARVLIRLQELGNGEHFVNSISLPTSKNGNEISGTDLRSIPVGALGVAYALDQQIGRSNILRTFQLAEEIESGYDPLTPLPSADSGEKFAALVGYQYQALEKRNPDGYIAGEMAELNDKPLPTVQRWIANARKLGYLPRTRSGRKPNA